MRILITGSRAWKDFATVEQAMWEACHETPERLHVIVHGGCWTGADHMADQICIRQGLTREVHEADWRPHGIYNPQAGLIRNKKMVELGAELCLAFIRNGSRGATHCAGLAEAAGIPTRRFIA